MEKVTRFYAEIKDTKLVIREVLIQKIQMQDGKEYYLYLDEDGDPRIVRDGELPFHPTSDYAVQVLLRESSFQLHSRQNVVKQCKEKIKLCRKFYTDKGTLPPSEREELAKKELISRCEQLTGKSYKRQRQFYIISNNVNELQLRQVTKDPFRPSLLIDKINF